MRSFLPFGNCWMLHEIKYPRRVFSVLMVYEVQREHVEMYIWVEVQ